MQTYYCPETGLIWTSTSGARPVRPVYDAKGRVANLPHRPCF